MAKVCHAVTKCVGVAERSLPTSEVRDSNSTTTGKFFRIINLSNAQERKKIDVFKRLREMSESKILAKHNKLDLKNRRAAVFA